MLLDMTYCPVNTNMYNYIVLQVHPEPDDPTQTLASLLLLLERLEVEVRVSQIPHGDA